MRFTLSRLLTLCKRYKSGLMTRMYVHHQPYIICNTKFHLQPLYDFLNISTAGQTINGYQKRLVHQIVRSKYPNLTTLGKSTFVQVVKNDPAAEKLKREERRARFDKDLQKGVGLRHVIDALFKSRKPLIGHNLFTDLINLYKCFVGGLPETVKEFGALIHGTFPM